MIQEEEFAMAQDEFAHLIEFLRSRQGRELNHTELEATLNDRCRELMRVLLQAQMDSQGPGAAVGPVCGVDGVERREQRLHERGLSTIFGEVRIKRLGYAVAGVASLHPLDGQLNLPAGECSLGVRRLAAEQAAQVSFEATVEALARQTGKTMGKRQVEEPVQRAAVDFDRRWSTSACGRAWRRRPRRSSRRPSARPCGATPNGRSAGWAWSTAIRPNWICSRNSRASTR